MSIETALLLLNVFQLFFWGHMVQRLVDKNMSKNYYDYQVARSVENKKEIVRIPSEVPEDLRGLNEISPF